MFHGSHKPTPELDARLDKAARKGDFETVRAMLNQGALMYDKDRSSIREAIQHGHADIASYLLKKRGNMDNGDALMAAVEFGQIECVAAFLAEGIPPRSQRYGTAIGAAAADGRTDMVRLLLNHGADLHDDEDFALRYAAKNGHAETVMVLLENGANLRAVNDWAFTAVEAEHGYAEIIALLSVKGARLDAMYYEALQQFDAYATLVSDLPFERCLKRLIQDDGSATITLKALAASNHLTTLFKPTAWEGRLDEARQMYEEVSKALPKRYRGKLGAVDTVFLQKDASVTISHSERIQARTCLPDIRKR